MTLEQFTISRRDELVAFFRARFGKPWRRLVANQAGMHPRFHDRWKGVPPLSLYRQIHKLETWARTIGFVSATDSEVQRNLKLNQEFKDAATREVAETKRIRAELAEEERQSGQMREQITAAMQRVREENIRQAAAESAGKGSQGPML